MIDLLLKGVSELKVCYWRANGRKRMVLTASRGCLKGVLILMLLISLSMSSLVAVVSLLLLDASVCRLGARVCPGRELARNTRTTLRTVYPSTIFASVTVPHLLKTLGWNPDMMCFK